MLWVKILFSLAACYLVALFVLWGLQEILIFHPRTTPPDNTKQFAPLSVQYQTPDGVMLHGWLTQHPPAPNADCQLLIYFGGNAEEISQRLTDEYFNLPQLYVNYRGYGHSEGKPSADVLRRDALFIYDTIQKQQNIPMQKICVMGGSLGTHMAIHVAANRPVAKLVLVSPYDSITNIARHRYPIFPVRWLLRHPFDSLAEAAKVRAPTLILLAEKDWIVPAARSQNLIKQWVSPLQVHTLPKTTHNTIQTDEYWQIINTFIQP